MHDRRPAHICIRHNTLPPKVNSQQRLVRHTATSSILGGKEAITIRSNKISSMPEVQARNIGPEVEVPRRGCYLNNIWFEMSCSLALFGLSNTWRIASEHCFNTNWPECGWYGTKFNQSVLQVFDKSTIVEKLLSKRSSAACCLNGSMRYYTKGVLDQRLLGKRSPPKLSKRCLIRQN